MGKLQQQPCLTKLLKIFYIFIFATFYISSGNTMDNILLKYETLLSVSYITHLLFVTWVGTLVLLGIGGHFDSLKPFRLYYF